ncbi:hypothetical protein, partial [Klebsiella pneumoniae]|uniref:hypothetical protein n=1 Tax=Klebsiella pneumoniae TaxID=573 RepID=UPI0027313EF3
TGKITFKKIKYIYRLIQKNDKKKLHLNQPIKTTVKKSTQSIQSILLMSQKQNSTSAITE